MRPMAITLMLCVAGLLAGCQQKLAVDIIVTVEPDADIASINRFIVTSNVGSVASLDALRQRVEYYADDYVRVRSTEPGEQLPPTDSSTDFATLNELATLVQSRLNARGYISSPDPQFIVRVDFVNVPYRYNVPEQIIPNTNIDPSVGAMGSQGRNDDTYIGDIIVPGHQSTVYSSGIAVSIYLPAHLESPVWSASIVTAGPTQFRGVAPLLLDELLREFPIPTDQPQQRKLAVPD